MINSDRTHPNQYGNEFMAQIFLKSQGFDIKIKREKDELETLSELTFDECENKRFGIGRMAKANDFVNRGMCPNIKKPINYQKKVESYPLEYANAYMKDHFEFYLNNEDKTEENLKILIAHTKSIYE